jgi:eukaryotic-like serine/threonine-protein kinase
MNTWAFQIGEAPGSPTVPFPPLSHFVVGSGPHAAIRLEQLAPSHIEVTVNSAGQASIKAVSGAQLLVNGTATVEAALQQGTHLQVGPLKLIIQHTGEPVAATVRRLTPFAGQAPLPLTDEAASVRTVLPSGALIAGRYRVVQKLAAGGMGEVYRVEHVELHKPFALKVMLPALSNDAEFVNRFKREAISASRIGQLNIVDISDFGQTDEGRFYFVMEFLDGLTLASLLHRQGALPLTRAVSIGLQTARALSAAHAQGIVHRDMKPENVMVLQRPGQPDLVKVLDFGVAKVSTGPGFGGQTQLGVVVGTPQYMSPEQAMGVAVDARTDLYALGLILYEMVTGKPTFVGDTASILMVKQVTELPAELPETLAANVPASLHELMYTLLEKDPKQRPASLENVVRTLEQLEAQLRLEAKLPPATSSGRYRRPSATPHHSSAVRVSATGQAMPVAVQGHASTPPMDTAPPRSRGPWLAAAVLLALAMGGGLWSLRPGAPAAEPVPAPLVLPLQPAALEPLPSVDTALVRYRLQSEPPGAEVFEADVSLGLTPFVIQRPPETLLDLSWKLKGHLDVSRKLKVPATDGTYTLTLEEKPAEPKVPRPTRPPTKPKIERNPSDDLKGLDDP